MRSYRVILGAVIAIGCSGRAIDVGPADGAVTTDHGGSSGSSGGSGAPTANSCVDTTPLPTWPDPSACVASSSYPLIGTWQGYVENAATPWDQLALVINGASVDGGVCGTLTIGVGPVPAPATDPTADYPPGQDHSNTNDFTVVPGVALTLLSGKTDGTRVQFSVAPTQAWRSWCALQSSFSNDSVPCSCLPDWAKMTNPPSDQCTLFDPLHAHNLTVNCAQMFLCDPLRGPCACNASGCDASTAGSINFDLRFTADMGEGSNDSNPQVRTIFTRSN